MVFVCNLNLKRHRMMKKLLFIALCWASALGVQAEDYPYLVFTQTDGSTVTLPVQSLCIKFVDGKLVATTTSVIQTLPLDGLTTMAFTHDAGTPSAVQGVDQGGASSAVQVYTLHGIHVGGYNSAAQALRALPKGVYIIRQEQNSYLKAIQ